MYGEGCLVCHFASGDIVDGEKVLICRRHAPQMLSGSGTGWSDQLFPIVTATTWCGDYKYYRNTVSIPSHRHQPERGDE